MMEIPDTEGYHSGNTNRASGGKPRGRNMYSVNFSSDFANSNEPAPSIEAAILGFIARHDEKVPDRLYSRERASELVAVLNSDLEDDWRYRMSQHGDSWAIAVLDSFGELLGYI